MGDCLSEWKRLTRVRESLSDGVSAGARISFCCCAGSKQVDGGCLVTKEGWAVIRTSGGGGCKVNKDQRGPDKVWKESEYKVTERT